MTEQHVFVVLNPVAGRTQAEETRKALQQHFPAPAWRIDLYQTTGEEDVSALVREAIAEGADRVYAAGGDGTVSAVVDGLVGSSVPLGIVPAGTSNTLAQELNIPLSVDRACAVLAGQPTVRTIDALQCGQQYFVLSVGTGLGAQTIKMTGRQRKRRYGVLAYVATFLQVLLGLQPHVFTIVVDGTLKRVRAADILLANISKLTGPILWGRHIAPDDGRIDICIVRAQNLRDLVLVAWDMLVPGRPRHDRNLRYLSANHSVLVMTDEPLPVQGDGEDLGHTPFEVTLRPGAVRVLVPQKNQRPSVVEFLRSRERPAVLDELLSRGRE